MKKIAALFIAFLLVFGVCGNIFAGSVKEYEKPIKAEKNEPTRKVYSGTCGDDLTWTLDTETGVLEITGTGDMEDWAYGGPAPWISYTESIETVVIGNGVTNIGGFAFQGCSSLTLIDIPDGVLSIDWGAFNGCTSLTSIDIPDGVTSIGSSAFERCTSLASILIPDGVTSIGSYAFRGCTSLASIDIPDSVTSISYEMFYGCTSLTSVVIPNNVTSIGWGAFEDCSSLTSIVIPNSVTSIGGAAFYGCTSLSSIVIPDGVTSIENYVFKGCNSLTSINIPNGVTSIGIYAFSGCSSLTSINIPDSVTSIGNYTFEGCTSLIDITVDPNNQQYTSVDGVLFNKAKTELIKCPGRKAGDYTIPGSVTSIGNFAFEGCSSLTSIVIPNSVTSIDDWAFYGCTSLYKAIFLGEPPASFGSSVFNYCASDFCIYYTSEHASEWAPNGETEWNGYPIRLFVELTPYYGDADCNGTVDFDDITLLNAYLLNAAELSEQGLLNANVNGDGKVSSADVVALNKLILGSN